jgi:hypothetical protein
VRDLVAYGALGAILVVVAILLVYFPRPSLGAEDEPAWLRLPKTMSTESSVEYLCVGGPWADRIITIGEKARAVIVMEDDRPESDLLGKYVLRHDGETPALHWEPNA